MTRARAAAATGLVVFGLLAGCARTTEGTVAMTTEPGPPLTSAPTPSRSPGMPSIPGLPEITIPNFPMPGRDSDVPVVPAPPNALDMACSEYMDLDEATRVAVVRAILAEENNPLGPDGETIGQILADAACQFLPSAKVSDMLLGGGVP